MQYIVLQARCLFSTPWALIDAPSGRRSDLHYIHQRKPIHRAQAWGDKAPNIVGNLFLPSLATMMRGACSEISVESTRARSPQWQHR